MAVTLSHRPRLARGRPLQERVPRLHCQARRALSIRSERASFNKIMISRNYQATFSYLYNTRAVCGTTINRSADYTCQLDQTRI